MQKLEHSPIFITGIERSGSTVVAKIIQSCGAFTGETTDMLENKKIKNLVDYYYNRILKIPKYGQKPLPNTRWVCPLYEWKDQITNALREDGYDDQSVWMYKNFRICQIWPVWDRVYPNAKWVIVRRRTGDIIQSCLKTGFMNAYSDQIGWLGWIHEHEKLFVEMLEKGLNCKIIWPERMAMGDYQQMQETIEWLGLTWNDEAYNIGQTLKSKQQKLNI
jgi:hypothetical protein